MTLTPFADLVHLNTDRIADPAAEGGERFVSWSTSSYRKFTQSCSTMKKNNHIIKEAK